MSAPSFRWGDNSQSHLLKRRGSEKMECLGDLNSSCQIFAWWGLTVRSSRPGVFCKKGVLRSLTKFTGKHLCQSLFFNKVAGLSCASSLKNRLSHRFCPVNFAKFLRIPFSKNTSGRRLLRLFQISKRVYPNPCQRSRMQRFTKIANNKKLIHFKYGKIWDKLFKNGPSKICERQPLKNLKG